MSKLDVIEICLAKTILPLVFHIEENFFFLIIQDLNFFLNHVPVIDHLLIKRKMRNMLVRKSEEM